MSTLAKLPVRMTIQDFFCWESGNGQRYELVNGEPRAMALARPVHGFLHAELGALIGNHLQANAPCFKAVMNPAIIPRFLSTHNLRIPELGVTSAAILPEQVALPDPVLLIELLSFSNQADTWSNVWTYTSIPSVQEILVLHSTRIAAEVLRRTEAGGWPEQTAEVGERDDLVLESIGFRVPMAELYAGTGLST